MDEALAELLAEEDDDFFFGEDPELIRRQRAGEDSDSSSPEVDDVDAVDPETNNDGDVSDDDSSALHHLEQEVDTSAAARKFLAGDSSSARRVTDLSGEASARPLETRHQCGCSKDCLKAFDAADVEQNQLSMAELAKEEKELLILGLLESARHNVHVTSKGRKRKRQRFAYSFLGVEVCVGAFLYVYGLGKRQLENLLAHLEQNGLVPRVHGNTGRKPKHALTFPVIENLVEFLHKHAVDFGIPHPAPLHGRDGTPPTFLPASQNYQTVHKMYLESCQLAGINAVGYNSFRNIWHQCMPHLKFMTPRTDVCDKCELLRRRVSASVEEQEKLDASTALREHVEAAQRERMYYVSRTTAAKEELDHADDLTPPPHRPCSKDLTKVHYTFDFAQNVALPHTARQVGPLYFKTPRKVQIFGVNVEAIPKQVNYLIDENETIGENGKNSHGPNTVVSLLHHFFEVHGSGEKECFCHCDNCGGQNKNKTVMAYFAWRTLTGLHQKINVSFMVAGHTRCLVDGCFGLLKQKFRRSDVFCLQQLEAVVNSSAACNVAQLLQALVSPGVVGMIFLLATSSR